ncbi:MAG: low molecular weight protein tyrosine phosphatase family protein [Opitutales bacterium]
MNVLFICSQNRLRSPTAEAVFAEYPGLAVDSAGLDRDAVNPLSPEQVEWADAIVVMERRHRTKLEQFFRKHLNGQRVIVLDIPDRYSFMQPELIAELRRKTFRFLG